MIKNMCTGIVGNKKKHQSEKYSQQVDIYSWNTIVVFIVQPENIKYTEA